MLRALRLMLVGISALAAFPSAVPAASAEFRLLRIDGYHLKWGAPAYGTAAEVSYGFATVTQRFPDAINCGEIDPVGVLTGRSADHRARLEAALTAAVEMWSAAAGLGFRRAAAGEAPDILIGAQALPEGIAFANVWHDAAAAVDGIAPLTRATICLNPQLPWLAANVAPANEVYDLRTALAHEIGHAIGLDHPGATGALMAYRNQGILEALLPGDVSGALALYGPRAAD